jgi:myo-inositol-1(or 4)-monophosphatase
MKLKSDNYEKLVQHIRDLAIYAKENLPTSFKEKTINELVCEIDEHIEREIKSFLGLHFPGENVWGEESGGEEGGWLIDPIDGTGHYLHGLPLSSISLVQMKDGESMFAIVANIMTGEVFLAEKGKGSWLIKDGVESQLVFNKDVSSERTMVSWDHVMKEKAEAEIVGQCYQRCLQVFSRTRMFGSGALSLCYMTKNYFQLYVKSIRKTKEKADIFAGLFIAQEAGASLEVIQFQGMDFYLVGTRAAIDTAKSEVLF